MKRNIFIKILTLAVLGIFTVQCDSLGDFGDMNVDPNNPSQPNTSYLYIYAVRNALPSFYLTGTYDPWAPIYAQYFSERTNIQFTQYSGTLFAVGGYYTGALKNLDRIIRLNTDDATKEQTYVTMLCASNANQIAVARTLRAYIYMHLTDAVGMIPYSEALGAVNGVFKPKYDDQQSIYTDLDKELNEAYAQFVEGESLHNTYEILYNGDIAKWKKFNASIRMQLAIKLFKNDASNGQTRFAKAFADGFIRENADLLEYKYLSENANQNPLYDNMVVSARRDFYPSNTLIDMLKEYNDPRLMEYAVPNAYGEYVGMPFGLNQEAASTYSGDDICNFHEKHYRQNSPAVLITPSVMLLAAAEAAERGWITANAKSLYDEAITKAFAQHGIGAAAAVTYLAQPAIAYKTGGTSAERIAQIATQKWLASYMQDSFEAWSDWRRLGVPDLKPGASSLLDAIPVRRIYGTDDYNANMDAYKAAIAAQGADLMSTKVWWNK
jgi:hypothetical protein